MGSRRGRRCRRCIVHKGIGRGDEAVGVKVGYRCSESMRGEERGEMGGKK